MAKLIPMPILRLTWGSVEQFGHVATELLQGNTGGLFQRSRPIADVGENRCHAPEVSSREGREQPSLCVPLGIKRADVSCKGDHIVLREFLDSLFH